MPVRQARGLGATSRSSCKLQDKGYHTHSQYPMLPLFAAAGAIHDKGAPVDWPAVDVITNRNGLRKLLRWLNPSRGQKMRDFRIDVELVGSKSIILSRWDDVSRYTVMSHLGPSSGHHICAFSFTRT